MQQSDKPTESPPEEILRDLTQIRGIGPQRSRQLFNAGIRSCSDLRTTQDLDGLSQQTGIRLGLLQSFQYSAQAIQENIILRKRAFDLDIANVMFLDIETNLGCVKVWLIGVLYNGVFHQFYADTFEEEPDILRAFAQLVDKIQPKIIVSYSGMGFDQRVLIEAYYRNGLPCPRELRTRHVDLLQELHNCFILPSSSYRLKKLGAVFGYQFQHQTLDGFQVAMAYEHHLKYGGPLDLRLFEYNKDDVYALQYLIKYLQCPTDHKLKDIFLIETLSGDTNEPLEELKGEMVVPRRIPREDPESLNSLFNITPEKMAILQLVGITKPYDLLELSSRKLKKLKQKLPPRSVELWLQQAAHWFVYHDHSPD